MPKRKGRSGRTELPITALSYTGPSYFKKAEQNDDTITVILLWDQAMTASGTALNPTWTMNNPANCPDWNSYKDDWDQYRVLSLRVEFHPNSLYTNASTNSYAAMYTVVDRDTAVALSSYASASQYGSLRVESLDKPFTRDMKMNGVTEAQFFNTQSMPSSGGGIKWFASGLSNVTFGRAIAYYVIQFRGTGI